MLPRELRIRKENRSPSALNPKEFELECWGLDWDLGGVVYKYMLPLSLHVVLNVRWLFEPFTKEH